MDTTQINLLVNNTCVDIRGAVEEAVWAAARSGSALPEEIADLFTLTIIDVGGELRAVLDLA